MISVGRFTSLAVATVVATGLAMSMAKAGFGGPQDQWKRMDRVATAETADIADAFALFDLPATVTEIRDEGRQTSIIVRGTAKARSAL